MKNCSQFETKETILHTEKEAKRKSRVRVPRVIFIILAALAVIAVIVVFLLTSTVVAVAVADRVIIPNIKYDLALDALENGDYDKAYKLFYSLGDYKDSEEQLQSFYVGYETHVQEHYVDGGIEYVESVLLNYGVNGDFDSTYIYDEKGNFIRAEHISDSGDRYVTEYLYDDDGRVIQKKYTNEVGAFCQMHYTYDDSGDWAYVKEEYSSGLYYEWYYENGECLRYIYCNPYGKVYSLVERIYSDGKVTAVYCTGIDGDLEIYEDSFEGDIPLMDVVGFNEARETVTFLAYEYDEAGNIIRRTNPFGEVFEYQYDDEGRLIREACSSVGYEYILSYDESGKIIAVESLNGKGEYFYDKSGNQRVFVFYFYDGVTAIQLFDKENNKFLDIGYGERSFELLSPAFEFRVSVTEDGTDVSIGEKRESLRVSILPETNGLQIRRFVNTSVYGEVATFVFRASWDDILPNIYGLTLRHIDLDEYGYMKEETVFNYNGLEIPSIRKIIHTYEEMVIEYDG